MAKKFEYEEFKYDPFKYANYKESDAVNQAGENKTAAEEALKNYGNFNYANQGAYDDIMNKILNREKFSYDLNGDALYQQYKDKYIQQGKMAMQDTMGQAAAMTGGYGNSYAATVGNQAYQASLENLNDIVPELYQMAYDKYNQEGQDLYNQYGMLSNDRATQYGEWSDGYNKLATDRDYYANSYNNERSWDYNKYANERDFAYGKYADDRNFSYGQYSDNKSLAYQDHRNTIADEQWQAQFDEAKRQYDESMAFQKEQASKKTVVNNVAPEEEEEEQEFDYSSFTPIDWQSYFAQIRSAEGQEAAEAELQDLIRQGKINGMDITFAANGARGSSGGH